MPSRLQFLKEEEGKEEERRNLLMKCISLPDIQWKRDTMAEKEKHNKSKIIWKEK